MSEKRLDWADTLANLIVGNAVDAANDIGIGVGRAPRRTGANQRRKMFLRRFPRNGDGSRRPGEKYYRKGWYDGWADCEAQAPVPRPSSDELERLRAVLLEMAGEPCEEATIPGEIRCDERMGSTDGWAVKDWCYTCQARAALAGEDYD